MNLFYLDKDLKVNAESHVDKHVGKMIMEAVQLVCTAFHLQDIEAPYKKTHPNHPSAIWTRNSMLQDLMRSLCLEANTVILTDHLLY